MVVEPVKNIRGNALTCDCWVCSQREQSGLRVQTGPGFFQTIACITKLQAPGVLFEKLNAPTQSRCEPQCALMIKPTVVEIVGRHAGSDANQAFRLFGGSEQLRHTLIRESVHPDATVGFCAGPQPCDRFRTIAALVAKGIELAAGIAASADILNDYVEATAREPDRMRIHDGR